LFSGAAGPAVADFDEALKLDPSNSHALGGRALAQVQLRKPLEAIADARAAVRVSPKDARQLYSAARVLCQAAVCLESDSGRAERGWAAAGRCRAEAMELLARALDLTPEEGRARFLTEVVRSDAAFEPIRRNPKFIAMEARATQSRGALPAGDTKP
jgi:tetratricopeptide (TPR) repeat protein